MLFGSMI